jgi:nitric oxide reductase NorD protein
LVQEDLVEPESAGPTRFALLAQAIAGRRVRVVALAQGRAYTDGTAIFLPELPEPLLQGAVVVQAGLIAAGSLEPRVMARVAGRRSLRLRYLSLEAVRAAHTLDTLMPARVFALLAEVYAGPVPSSAQESLAWASSEAHAVPEAPEWLGTIKPLKLLGAAPRAELPEAAAPGWVEAALRELDDDGAYGRDVARGLVPAPIRNALASVIEKLPSIGRSAEAERGGPAELLAGGWNTGAVAANRATTGPPGALTLDLVPASSGGLYPEWDCVRGDYRRDWCAVREIDPREPKREPAPISSHDARLRRRLARLGLTQERHRRQADGDGLDLTALLDLVVERAAGRPGDPRVYETRRRTARDLGVLVVLDATRSTGQSADGVRVFDEERMVAARLTAALAELGVRVATYGFHSQGPKAIHFLRVKDFDDRYDPAAQRRLAALTPGGFTRLGAGIRHGAHMLSSRAGTSLMLLVLLSDGVPYEQDYERIYAQADTRQALRETVTRGIGCACVSVRARTDAALLERVWGDVPYRRLPDASALERHVQPLFREAMRAAIASRRPVRSRASTRSGYPVAPARREIARTRR